MCDEDMREFVALTLNLRDGDARRLVEQLPGPALRELRRQCVRESSILPKWGGSERAVEGESVQPIVRAQSQEPRCTADLSQPARRPPACPGTTCGTRLVRVAALCLALLVMLTPSAQAQTEVPARTSWRPPCGKSAASNARCS